MTKAFTAYSIKKFALLLKIAFKELGKNDPLRMAGATAFFTTFALPPILIILTQALGLIYNPQKISRQLFERLEEVVGKKSAQQVVDVLTAIKKMAENWLITIGGSVFLLFIATTLFKVIKSSLNQILKIRVIGKTSIWYKLRSRFKSILVILITGVLFVVGLIAEGAQAYLGHYISELSPLLASYFRSALNHLVSLLIVTVWFAFVFRYLPDGQQEWPVVWVGALLTGILFHTGKLVIWWLLNQSNITTLYGASSSVVLLLLFVFYASLILYYGAAFTKVWGAYHNKHIKPLPHAIHYRLVESEEQI